MGRLNVYKSIPYDIAPEVLHNVALYFRKDIIPTSFETESGHLGMWPELSFTQVARRKNKSSHLHNIFFKPNHTYHNPKKQQHQVIF